MEQKVICINQSPLNPRSRKLSYVDTFLQLPIKFEYWDMTAYFTMFPSKVDAQDDDKEYIKKYATLGEVEEALKCIDCSRSCFFVGIPERWENRSFFKLLHDYNCNVLRSNPCANTMVLDKTIRDYIQLLKQPLKILNAVKRRMLNIYNKIYDIHYLDVFSSAAEPSRTVKINHPDYDDYMKLKNQTNPSISQGRYAVFYDSYFPFHPDFKYLHKLTLDINVERYFDSMNQFFSDIEKRYDLEVIIAAHPISEYKESDFCGRKIIKWRTCELTMGAQMIINQSSNSTSFAILANKPIIFITSDELEKCTYMSRYIAKLSKQLGKQKINIDNYNIDSLMITQVDAVLRQGYIYDYLTDATTEDVSNEDIYMKYVQKIIACS
jgi:hypothetical protein